MFNTTKFNNYATKQPKVVSDAKMIIKLLVDAGDMKPNPAISQKLGPLGLNLGKIIQDVNKATAQFKGIKVPVSLDIDTKTRNFKVEVSTPPTSELLKKEFGLEKGSGDSGSIKVANAALEQIVAIAKTKHQAMLTEDFKKAVKNVVGTCVSLGILIENRNAKEISKEIDAGKFDDIINKQETSVSAEKKAQLESHFAKVKAKQDEMLKKKAEEEAAKAAAAPAAGAAVAGTATAATATKEAGKPAAKATEAKKAEAGKAETKKAEKPEAKKPEK
jgi:large subunit ribosomal protein L11